MTWDNGPTEPDATSLRCVAAAHHGTVIYSKLAQILSFSKNGYCQDRDLIPIYTAVVIVRATTRLSSTIAHL